MKKYLLIFIFICDFVFAKVDYSEMSTQELIAIMGYVKLENKEEFYKELQSRVKYMNEKEKLEYEKNLSLEKEKIENLQENKDKK